jgi:serine phosphatase RsbU (regulator of sigma subunit)
MPSEDPAAAPLALLVDLGELLEASSVDDVLRAAVAGACRLSASRRGTAGLFDGEAATAEAWFDARAGWTHERRRWSAGSGPPGRACASAATVLRNERREEGPWSEDASGLGPVPLVCLPLPFDEGRALGFLMVGDRDDDYSPGDARLLAAYSRVAAARLREVAGAGRRAIVGTAAQADVAERLQRQLLPADPPVLPGADIAFAYRSASAGVLSGGDFVDYYTRPPSSTLAFAIGDVAGKGVEAMAVTFVTKYILRAAVFGGQLSWPINPGEALQELRTALLEQPGFGEDTERFVTVLFGLLSVRHGKLELASAGHPTPFLVREGVVERPLLLTEPAIGVELGAALAPYPTESRGLPPGGRGVRLTDRITEMRDAAGAFFEDEMAGLLAPCHDRPAAEVVSLLMGAAEKFSARPASDDRAVLCIRLTGGVE